MGVFFGRVSSCRSALEKNGAADKLRAFSGTKKWQWGWTKRCLLNVVFYVCHCCLLNSMFVGYRRNIYICEQFTELWFHKLKLYNFRLNMKVCTAEMLSTLWQKKGWVKFCVLESKSTNKFTYEKNLCGTNGCDINTSPFSFALGVIVVFRFSLISWHLLRIILILNTHMHMLFALFGFLNKKEGRDQEAKHPFEFQLTCMRALLPVSICINEIQE